MVAMKVIELTQRLETLDGDEEIPLEAVVAIYLTNTTKEDIDYAKIIEDLVEYKDN